MRRVAPLVLLLGLLLPVAPAAAQTPSPRPGPTLSPAPTGVAASNRPSPPPPPSPTPVASAPPATRTVTLADDGATVRLRPGDVLDVRLPAPTDGAWRGVEGLETGTATLHLVALRSARQQELTASLQALSAGRYGGSTQVRPQRLRAEEELPCSAGVPACAAVGRGWSVDVVVEDGPPVTTALPCTPIAYAIASPAPGSAVLFRNDDGRTVQVDPSGTVSAYLGSCEEPALLPPRATPPLFRESVQVDRRNGTVNASFRPQTTGRAQLSSAYDARCLHRTDAAGDGECAVTAQVFAVTVDVLTAPGPPPACDRLSLTGPSRVAAGAEVPLVGSGATPGAEVQVLFRRRGATQFEVRRTLVADAQGAFRTRFAATDDHRWAAASRGCLTPAGLTQAAPVVTGPAVVPRGSTITLRVLAAQGVRTYVFFRGAGEPFSARRLLTGPGTVTYTATRDQRYYALTGAVASTPGLTQVR